MGFFLVGFAVGAATLGLVAAVDLGFGLVTISTTPLISPIMMIALLGFGLTAALAGALLEELVFRGSLFSHAGSLPAWAAMLLISVPFAALHVMSSGFGMGFVSAAVIGSIFFALIRLATGNLAFAIGWHAAWNFMQYSVLGLATIGSANGGHALVQFTRRSNADIWLGQGQSIEGGIVAGSAILLSALAAFVIAHRKGVRLSQSLDAAMAQFARVRDD
ncbi:CPBP family intramembrane glutamic endopeptidase [Sphingomonas sp. 28-62-11]|uniref:CPBP family intramembrane glutamic endopeptidase n=1 Tax=Sphingomonas sp. 28-62-11 TaxID=1970432 RepID=UPI000BD4EA2C|nr:MAG: hypothetical protein B7Y49_05240 [Sphingomonas sp. 28-62-11]